MSDEEEPAPSAPGSEIGNDDAASDAEQASSAHKCRKTGLTQCDDEYTVSKLERREALSAKTNTGKFSGLRAPHIQAPALLCAFCLSSLAFSLVYALFVACAHSLALHVSPKKILKYITLFCVEKYRNTLYNKWDMSMFLFPPQTAKMNHVKALLHLQFPLTNGGDVWTKDAILQDTERRILELVHKAESERRARFSAQKAETTSKQPAANACLHATALPPGKAKVTFIILCEAMEDSENSRDSEGGDVFEESVVDATKRDFFAFKSEAKRWSQSDNRPSAPSTSAGSATRTTSMSALRSFRNLHMYLCMYMLYLVCDLTEVFFIVSKRSFIPENCLFLSSSGLPAAT